MKIQKLRIQNFKVFKDILIDFESSDTIVFDGPNGFGKTTIYDAIELVFTGKIRRYNALKNGLIDNRQTFLENPFYNEDATDREGVFIRIQFTSNNISYILERIAQFDQINGALDFGIYKLYKRDDFDIGENTLIEDEQAYLSEIFGNNYDSNFQFLNYVEQEECLFLLKNTDKNRKNHIAHLFDLKGFELKIKRIDELKRRIDLLCNPAKKTENDSLEKEIKLIKETLSTDVSVSEYLKLFPDKDFDWDRENLDIKNIEYHSIAGTNGLLDRIKLLITRKDFFKQYRRNSGIDYLTENRQLLHNYFKYNNFLAKKDEFRMLKNEANDLKSLVNKLNNLNNQNLDEPIDFSIYSFILSDLKEQFFKAKKDLQNILKELSGLDRIYADISVSRNLLKEKLITLKDNSNANGECLFCGHDWGTIEELLDQIDLKATQIRDINSDKSNRFESSFAIFKSGIIQDLIGIINQRLSSIIFDSMFVDQLLKIENNYFNQLVNTLDFLKFDYSRYLNKQPAYNAVILMKEFISEITSLKVSVDEQLIDSDFQLLFNQYFEGKHDKLDLLYTVNIEKKQYYLKYLWSLSQNALLSTKSSILVVEKQKYNDAKELSNQLNFLKNKYQGSLKAFQTKIIRDIEIIFHIYSGRIMQCFQGGLGLFIFSEKEGIRFQSNPYKTYDAVFSMSSGQLSALIISFTLALHKKYSQNKLILIDDPVQTMDELNLYGFIDLLRNEFCNHQIIISTHEDMMSAFMRYKFKNYNLSEKRINLKELMQV